MDSVGNILCFLLSQRRYTCDNYHSLTQLGAGNMGVPTVLKKKRKTLKIPPNIPDVAKTELLPKELEQLLSSQHLKL